MKTANEVNLLLREIQSKNKLANWNAFVEQLRVPGELMPALATGRAELVRIAPARALSEDECRVLYELIAGLIETNGALQMHARHTAQLVRNWGAAFKTLESVGRKIDDFANFRMQEVDEKAEAFG